MEMFAMGPKRSRDDPGGKPPPSLDPIELGSADADLAAAAAPSGASETSAPALKENWLSGLVRADVLALTAAALLVLTVIGMPFMGFAESMLMFIGPSTALMAEVWVFVPGLAASAVAAMLGLAALRQATRQDAAGWIRAVAGTSTLLGVLLVIGTTIVWLYASESQLFENFNRFF